MPNKRAAKIRKMARSLKEAERVSEPPSEISPERRRARERTAAHAVNAILMLAAAGWTRRYRRSKPRETIFTNESEEAERRSEAEGRRLRVRRFTTPGR